MSKFEKLLFKLLSGNADNNFSFDFIERTTGGSHRIFYKEGIEDIINIQPKGSKAKTYQVKQVRLIVLKYKLIDDGK
jgi:hypothetical protein